MMNRPVHPLSLLSLHNDFPDWRDKEPVGYYKIRAHREPQNQKFFKEGKMPHKGAPVIYSP